MRSSTTPLLMIGLVALLLVLVGTAAAGPSVEPSRTTVQRSKQPSMKGEQMRRDAAQQREIHDRTWKADVIREQQELARKIEEMEKETDPEKKRLWKAEIEREEAEMREARKGRGSDPLYEMRQRREQHRARHDEEIRTPEVHAPEEVANITELKPGEGLHELLMQHKPTAATLLVSADCDRCEAALAAFRDAAAELSDEEYHRVRTHRLLRFAVLNVTEAPERFIELQTLVSQHDPDFYHFPVVLLLRNEHQHTGKQPHYVPFRGSVDMFRDDIEHAMRRVQALAHTTFRNEDELMYCLLEQPHDGVGFVFFHDIHERSESGSKRSHLDRLISNVLSHQELHTPSCGFSSHVRPMEDDVVDRSVLTKYNPNGAHVAAFFVNETDRDSVDVDYFTFHDDAHSPDGQQLPDWKILVMEKQRFRRWIERSLGRRHTSSGRRFVHVHRRQVYHHGNLCSPRTAAAIGDTVLARLRATSVHHDQVFFDASDRDREYVVGQPIDGLPPWLHNVFEGACPDQRREVYSPPKEGFHGELVDINVTEVRKATNQPMYAEEVSGEELGAHRVFLPHDLRPVGDDDEL